MKKCNKTQPVALPPLSPGQLLRVAVARQYLGDMGRSTYYYKVKRGELPKIRKLGPRTSVVLSDDIIRIIKETETGE